MPKFEFKQTVEVPTEKAEAYSKALQSITSYVEVNDLITLANKIKEKPGLVKKALKFI